MAGTALQVYTQQITNDRIRFNFPAGQNWKLLQLSVNLISGTANFGGGGIISQLGVPYSSSGYIAMTVGQPITISGVTNVPFSFIDIDATTGTGGTVQIVVTYIGDYNY